VLEIRKVLEDAGGSDIQIISKIENRDGVDNIEEILEVTDALMVARGDLGVEIPFEEVPLVQKMLISKCIEKGKPVITATQMLDSMIRNPRPTRAEVNDVANAIFDHTDAIMLSGETANGDFPIEAVKAMDKIAREVEASIDYSEKFDRRSSKAQTVKNITSAVSHSACTTARDLKAALISTVTMSGRAVRDVAKYRPQTPILACTPVDRTLRQMNLIWGCIPMNVDFEKKNVNTLFNSVAANALAEGFAKSGDLMVFTGGTPLGTTGSTNTIKVGIVGDTIAKGENTTGSTKNVTAHTNVVTSLDEAKLQFRKGDVFVTSNKSNDLMPYMMRAAAIIAGPGTADDFAHAVIIGKEMNIPVIISKDEVAQNVPDHLLVTVDSKSGVVYIGEK
jgi:pyruvate kinase